MILPCTLPLIYVSPAAFCLAAFKGCSPERVAAVVARECQLSYESVAKVFVLQQICWKSGTGIFGRVKHVSGFDVFDGCRSDSFAMFLFSGASALFVYCVRLFPETLCFVFFRVGVYTCMAPLSSCSRYATAWVNRNLSCGECYERAAIIARANLCVALLFCLVHVDRKR